MTSATKIRETSEPRCRETINILRKAKAKAAAYELRGTAVEDQRLPGWEMSSLSLKNLIIDLNEGKNLEWIGIIQRLEEELWRRE